MSSPAAIWARTTMMSPPSSCGRAASATLPGDAYSAYRGIGPGREYAGVPPVMNGELESASVAAAALIHSSPAQTDRASVTGAVSAARLLLDTERIEAGALARVSDLRAARQLVVEAADAARASLERDLHDGAQQRLVALRYALGLAGARAARRSEPALAATLAGADLAAERALADLRELAHGISAATLAVEGLAGAVRSAAEQARGAVTIVELPADRLPERVERAVYRLIADALREITRTPAPDLSIAVRRAGRDVVVELEYDHAMTGQDWPAARLADRVAAAGGQLQQADHHGHQRLIALLPCE
jgi:hypothetical protein